MKKAYAKPRLYAESFQLAEHISAGCGYIAQFGTGCGFAVDGTTFFTSAAVCSEDGIEMIQFNFEDEGPDYVVSVEDFINKMNPTCYNSLTDFHTMYNS